MAYAKFSAVFNPEEAYPVMNFSADRYTAEYLANAVPANAWCVTKATTGKMAVAFSSTAQLYFGVVDSNSINTLYIQNGITLRDTGEIDTWLDGTPTTIATIPGYTYGDNGMICIDMGAHLAWVTVDGVNYYGSAGAVYSASQVGEGSGGISVPQITIANLLAHFYGFGPCNCTINTGASAYPWALPEGFGNFPATLDVVSINAYENGVASVVWADSNCGALQYSLDGGTLTVPDGVVSGGGGTATLLGTLAGVNSHTLVLTDGSNPNDMTGPNYFWTPPNPGTGDVILNATGTLPNPSSTTPDTIMGTFTESSDISFTMLLNSVYMPPNIYGLIADMYLCYGSASNETAIEVYITNNVIDNEQNISGTLLLPIGTTGPTTFNVTGPWGTEGDTATSLITGSITVTSIDGDGNIFGNISAEHPGGTVSGTGLQLYSASSASSTNCIGSWRADGSFGFLDYGLSVYGPATLLPPAAPTGLAAASGGRGAAKITWNAVGAPADTLELYRGAGLGTAFDACALIASFPITTPNYLDTATAYGNSYTYYLVASDAAGESPPSNAATITLVAPTGVLAWNGVHR